MDGLSTELFELLRSWSVVVIALLTAIPARAGGRWSVVEILQSEHV